MELTKEHFDSIVEGLATKEDLKDLATKRDVEGAVEELARIISTTVANPLQQHLDDCQVNVNLHLEVRNIKHEVTKIKSVLHLE